jgi:hypothetical protein
MAAALVQICACRLCVGSRGSSNMLLLSQCVAGHVLSQSKCMLSWAVLSNM